VVIRLTIFWLFSLYLGSQAVLLSRRDLWWKKSGAAEQDFNRDKYSCVREALSAGRSSTITLALLDLRIGAKGWTKVSDLSQQLSEMLCFSRVGGGCRRFGDCYHMRAKNGTPVLSGERM
jgi:hypothetical protein